jgi:hypothetical protein
MEDGDRWVLGAVVEFHPDLTTVMRLQSDQAQPIVPEADAAGLRLLQCGFSPREIKCDPTRAALRSDTSKFIDHMVLETIRPKHVKPCDRVTSEKRGINVHDAL